MPIRAIVRWPRFAAVLALVSAAFAQSDFQLKPNDRVVFYGDSITDQRLYTTFVESFVVTRFPNLPVTFVHSGWGGDRVSGGGGGNIDTRLERDVFPYRPTVLTIMLGMNDGGYKALDEKLFEKYQNGYRHIIESVKQHEPECRITVIEPSAYDDVTRDPLFPGGYNEVLIRYSQFLKDLAGTEKLTVADLNTAVVEMLKRAKTADAESAKQIINDRVHPGPAGHLIMAAALLKGWGAPALVSDVSINASDSSAEAQNAQIVMAPKGRSNSREIVWNQLEYALPMPIDLSDKLISLAVDSSDVVDTLDREMLHVRNAPAAKYDLQIDGASVGSFTKQQLEQGINLARLSTPMLRQSLLVHQLTLDRALAHNIRWRQIQVPLKDAPEKEKNAALNALENFDRQLGRQQRAAAQTRFHHFELVPAAQ